MSRLSLSLYCLDCMVALSLPKAGLPVVQRVPNGRCLLIELYMGLCHVRRQKTSAELEAVRAQCTAATDQLRAQYSAEAESSRNARFEELERLRAEKNAEIELLRSKQSSEAEVWRAQRAADAQSATAELERQCVHSAEQLEAVRHECESLRGQLEDAVSREDNAVR